MVRTVITIEGYIAIDNDGRPCCRATSNLKKSEVGMTQVLDLMDGQSEFLTTQRKLLTRAENRLEVI